MTTKELNKNIKALLKEYKANEKAFDKMIAQSEAKHGKKSHEIKNCDIQDAAWTKRTADRAKMSQKARDIHNLDKAFLSLTKNSLTTLMFLQHKLQYYHQHMFNAYIEL